MASAAGHAEPDATVIEHTWYCQHKGRLGLKITPFGGDNSEVPTLDAGKSLTL